MPSSSGFYDMSSGLARNSKAKSMSPWKYEENRKAINRESFNRKPELQRI